MGATASSARRQKHITQAVAVLQDPNVYGIVNFYDEGEYGTRIEAILRGLRPGKHGFHVHEFGNLQNDCKAACKHYNPYNVTHGGPDSDVHHVGDLGNVVANHDGVAVYCQTLAYVHLNGPHSVVGRSIVVHEDADDLGRGGAFGSKMRAESLQTGNAGRRLACAVIGIAAES